MKNIIMIKNLNDSDSAKRIEQALSETRVDFSIDLDRKCVVIEGNYDMVSVARKVIIDSGFLLL